MDTSNSIFIVLEGTDGSGKTTQFNLLADRLTKAGYDVATFDFPQYNQPSSYFVKQYLEGEYNNGGIPGPYTASLFYALDRYEAAPTIRKALNDGKIVLANRFAGSNMAHQGTKLASPEERRGYFIWNDNLEFEMLHIPRPTVNYILRVPADIAVQQNNQKPPHSYTAKRQDLHESEPGHIQKSVEVYDDIAQLFPKDFSRIDCTRGGKMLPVESIHEILWQKIQPLLPEKPEGASGTRVDSRELTTAKEPAVMQEPVQAKVPAITKAAPKPLSGDKPTHEPVLRKDEQGGYALTEAGRHFLSDTVTNSTSNIFALTGNLDPERTAALVARFTKRTGDLRSTLLLEFADAADKDAALRTKTAFADYGDASVGQLASAYLVAGGVSGMLAKSIEHGRLAAFAEQSIAVSRNELKDLNGNYNYYIPEHFPDALKAQYKERMDTLFETYGVILGKVTDYLTGSKDSQPDPRATAATIASAVLPIATKTNVVMYASAQALETCIVQLLGDELPEARETGMKLLAEGRKVLPELLTQTDKSDRGGAQIVYRASTHQAVRKLAAEYVPDNHASQVAPLQLTSVWPRNEFDLLPDMLYPFVNRQLQDIADTVNTWPYDKKAAVFEAYIGNRQHRRLRPGRALERAHYSWDIVSDYAVFRELQQHNLVEDLQVQALTPRYGYEVPTVIEDAGASDEFEACFDLSLGLYSLLQQEGYHLEAQYATLLGHKLRWKVTYNAREAFHIHELRTSKAAHLATRQLVAAMHQKLSDVHPTLGESMKFAQI